jgi:hypothetical protein
MKRITMENCESLEGKTFKYEFECGTVKDAVVALIDKHIGATCVLCEDHTREVICFDFMDGDKYHSRASFLFGANAINRGMFCFHKWASFFAPEHIPNGIESELSECVFK